MTKKQSPNLHVWIDNETYMEATKILKSLNIKHSQAVNMFFRQIIQKGGIPFDLTLPSPLIKRVESHVTENNEIK